MFCCPICKKELIENPQSCICVNNHSFDKASEGYVHLLPANKMHAKIPGDSKQMVQCRRQFLNSGYYKPFSDELNKLCVKYIADNAQVIDAGCGEGYYTNNLQKALSPYSCTISAFDISKFAVKAAAKSYKNISFAVASIFDIPVASSSQNLLISIFAPIVPKEFYRALQKDGIFIIAVPGARHLFGLKQVLYDSPYENEEQTTAYEGFEQLERISVKDTITIDSAQMIQNLFTMTPYYWKTPEQGAKKLSQLNSLTTEIHFDFIVYRKI